jgi:outer membrane protein, multidrug efflux system
MRAVVTTSLAALLLAGCSMTPPYARPSAPIRASWPVGDAYLRQSEADLPAVPWRSLFADPGLATLIDSALTNNRDLAVALANVRAARARYRIQRADRFPVVEAGVGAGVQGADSDTSGRFSADIGITAFELDLFGRVAALSEAEQQRYLASEAGARAVRIALVGDVADAWVTLAADRSLLALAQDTAANARRAVTLTRARLEGGIAPRTDLRQAEQILFTAEADVARLTTAVAQDINALELLTGGPVDPALLPTAIAPAGDSIALVPAGLDSAVLLRRPDVIQAEYELRAANAEIGAARAALFPRISLTGLAGFASTALSGLFGSGGFAFSGNAGISYPIFNAGAGRAGVELSQAQRDAALASYEGAIQAAFRDVADALARAGTYAEEERAQRALVAAAEDTFTLTDARYRGGIDPFLTRLDAQRSLYSAQRTLVSTLAGRASNRIALYRALGADPSINP